jgi:hypothetical protein
LFGGHGIGSGDDPGQKKPAGHSVDVVTVGQKRPLGQASHDTLPTHVTKVPGSHLVGSHMPGLSHMYPIGHSVIDELFCFGQ